MDMAENSQTNYPGKRPQTVRREDSKGKDGKDLKASVAAS